MRKGINPQKRDYKVEMRSNHRIVMVIFIPEFTGYYASMFDVVKLSIDSLIKTIPETSKITLVDNGSCKEVQEYLVNLLKSESIDSLQLLTQNIGKIDALIGAARASREPIITLTDCDILFKPNWVFETIKTFNAFKNVASVSPIPSRGSFNYFTYSTKEAILRKKINLNFEPIKENFEEYNLFLKSINWDIEIEENLPWPVVQENSIKAIVGSDHQVLTVRRDVLFNNSPKEPSFIKVGSESEQNYIDFAIDSSGGLRLSTYNFYALHIGNILEEWMLEKSTSFLDKPKNTPKLQLVPKLNYMAKNNLGYKIKKKLIKYIFKLRKPSNY
ncbi:MAG: glycosyltransferase family 2 protein [Flavobacteriaceae bacterium]|nr:glycosyltransferase family 2 protein [Flavobacteriaceae bacterium]